MIAEKFDIAELLMSVHQTTSEFLRLVSFFPQETINQIPFENSWTAGQVAEHITRSNHSISHSLKQKGRKTSRMIDHGVPELRRVFMDLDKKLQSPRFILPTRNIYARAWVIDELRASIEQLENAARAVDYSEALDHPIFGEITKLELLHFVVYHTQRHIYQVRNIWAHVQEDQLTSHRKVILFIHTSLDGFVAGLNGETDWITIDEEIFEDSNRLVRTADVALFGRSTFQMMESYWPGVLTNSNSTEAEREHAQWMEQVNKIVFSTALEKVAWHHTRLIRENITAEVKKLKQTPGANMIIIGSPRLAHSFMERGLIDEFRINVNPVVLGRGVALFKDTSEKLKLKLLYSRAFSSGVVGLQYERKN